MTQQSQPGSTEVIRCPACHHLLRVPMEWLGAAVQCPECQARFRAPVRQGDHLSEPELLAGPVGASCSSPSGTAAADPALWLPAYGLIVCGLAGLIINLFLTWRLFHDPVAARAYVQQQIERLRDWGFGNDEPEEERADRDEQRTDLAMRHLPWIVPTCTVAAALALAGGVSIALRWNYRLAQLGCVAAALNLVGLCCLPGALVGLWGLLLLQSDEGREHFGLLTS
ncbi:MAG: zinc-ribbon domain-containing protein [Gemmataceae bacterium]|nr:zinc-ribbon domain-containing protein [Gemmataceae bacterium]MDW8243961.1 hypothetical protein [Thermogemmata sp.]